MEVQFNGSLSPGDDIELALWKIFFEKPFLRSRGWCNLLYASCSPEGTHLMEAESEQ